MTLKEVSLKNAFFDRYIRALSALRKAIFKGEGNVFLTENF